MHITVVFRSRESFDLSYSLLFIPCPVWQKGDREIINLHRENPRYLRGDVKPLLERESILSRLAAGVKEAVIVVHPEGVGTREDLKTLSEDLVAAGFTVQLLTFAASPT